MCSLVLLSLSVALLATVACQPATKSQTTPPGATDDDDTLPERPPIERSAELMASGQPGEALAALDAAIASNPSDPELHYARGIALSQLGRPDDAIAAWQQAVQQQPKFFPAHNGIGAIHLDAGRLPAAIAAFEAAIAADPNFPDAHYNLGRAREASGDPDGALAAFEVANRLAPEDVDVLVALTELHRKAQRFDKARDTAKVAARRAPDDAEVRRIYGHVLMELGDYPGAHTEFAAALQQQPGDADAQLGLARALVKQDRAEDALVPLADLANRAPTQAVVWSEWGAALAKIGRLTGPDGALAKLDQALKLKPELASAHIRKVGALAEARQCKAAREALKAFVALGPSPGAKTQAEAAAATCK